MKRHPNQKNNTQSHGDPSDARTVRLAQQPVPRAFQSDVSYSLDGRGRGLRSAEVASHLGIAVRTLEDWRRRKCGPPFHRLGKRLVVYFEDELGNWINAQRTR